MINSLSCVPKSANDCPNDKNCPTPDIKLAAVRAKIAPDKYPTPFNTLESIFFANIINGCTPTINPDNAAPNFGSISSAAPANPVTIPPRNSPMPCPISFRIGNALLRKLSKSGKRWYTISGGKNRRFTGKFTYIFGGHLL